MDRTLTNKADVLNRPIQHDDIMAAFNLCNCGTVCEIDHRGAQSADTGADYRVVRFRTATGWRTRKVALRRS